VRGHSEPNLRQRLDRGELVRIAYRLGRHAASGVLTLTGRDGKRELFVLRRGAAMCGEGELAKKTLVARLGRLAAEPTLDLLFEGGISAYPPGIANHVALAAWARQHLEAQLDGTRAEQLVRQLAGMRLQLRAELAPEAADEADRRMLAAMTHPRRLDQIWPLARTPRFRLLGFLYFLRGVDALEVEGIVAERSAPMRAVIDPRRAAALKLLGVESTADAETVKRAYRRLARALHPDLQPEVDEVRRRTLERRFAEVTAAYEALS